MDRQQLTAFSEACIRDVLQERLPPGTPVYLHGYLVENDYLALLQAVDDRNKLGHIYAAEEFKTIGYEPSAAKVAAHRVASESGVSQ